MYLSSDSLRIDLYSLYVLYVCGYIYSSYVPLWSILII
jgi:hypothetical protein